MNIDEANHIMKMTMSEIRKNVCSEENTQICGVNIEKIISSTRQIVNGELYEIEAETSAGNLVTNLYHDISAKTINLMSLKLEEVNITPETKVQVKL